MWVLHIICKIDFGRHTCWKNLNYIFIVNLCMHESVYERGDLKHQNNIDISTGQAYAIFKSVVPMQLDWL